MLFVLALAACELLDVSPQSELGSGDMQGWRFASGKTPSRAEYAALVAACQDGAVRRAGVPGASGALDVCLADLGLKRAQ
jgi:hypothetical protein